MLRPVANRRVRKNRGRLLASQEPDDRSGWSAEQEAFFIANEMRTTGGCLPPYITFEMAKLPAPIMAEIRRAGFPAPSAIQAAAWPVAEDGRDVVAIAKTGTDRAVSDRVFVPSEYPLSTP